MTDAKSGATAPFRIASTTSNLSTRPGAKNPGISLVLPKKQVVPVGVTLLRLTPGGTKVLRTTGLDTQPHYSEVRVSLFLCSWLHLHTYITHSSSHPPHYTVHESTSDRHPFNRTKSDIFAITNIVLPESKPANTCLLSTGSIRSDPRLPRSLVVRVHLSPCSNRQSSCGYGAAPNIAFCFILAH